MYEVLFQIVMIVECYYYEICVCVVYYIDFNGKKKVMYRNVYRESNDFY